MTRERAEWELVHQGASEDKTERLQIDGGWLYRTRIPNGPGIADSVAMTFISSPPFMNTGDVTWDELKQLMRPGYLHYKTVPGGFSIEPVVIEEPPPGPPSKYVGDPSD